MDILNRVSPQRFRAVGDLLAFISIYEGTKRTRAFRSLLRANAKIIRGSVCVEAGWGLGIFSIEMARLGARKVYAVEQNPLLTGVVSSDQYCDRAVAPDVINQLSGVLVSVSPSLTRGKRSVKPGAFRTVRTHGRCGRVTEFHCVFAGWD